MLGLRLLMTTSLDSTMSISILHLKIRQMYSFQNKLISDYIEPISQMVRTQTGAPAMVDSRGYNYIIHRVSKKDKKTAWRCRFKTSLWCNARATTLGDYIIKFYNEHNHPVPKNVLAFGVILYFSVDVSKLFSKTLPQCSSKNSKFCE